MGSAPSTSFQERGPSAMEDDDIVSLRPQKLWDGNPVHDDEGDAMPPAKTRRTDRSYQIMYAGENEYREHQGGAFLAMKALMRDGRWLWSPKA